MSTPKEGTARRLGRAEAKAKVADPRPLLTVREAADHLQTTERTVYRLIEAGQLRSVAIGPGRTRRRSRPVDLDAYLAKAAS